MKFTEDMIGKRVKEIATGDEGVIVSSLSVDNRAYVLWDNDGLKLWTRLDEVKFIDPPSNNPGPEEITIGGIRYKLTRIEE